jgi:hypothetical protein
VTREEVQAAVEAVLDAPRTVPGRLETIMAAADVWRRTGGGHVIPWVLTPMAEAELARWDGYARQAGAS